MNIFIALVVIIVAAALGIGAILLVRRHAPEGSYFNDGDRAAGVFGVLATGLAVLLGLVLVLAERTLRLLDQERRIVGDPTPVPCDAGGAPCA